MMLEKSENMPLVDQMLTYSGTPLDADEININDLGIENFSTLDLVSRLLGGECNIIVGCRKRRELWLFFLHICCTYIPGYSSRMMVL